MAGKGVGFQIILLSIVLIKVGGFQTFWRTAIFAVFVIGVGIALFQDRILYDTHCRQDQKDAAERARLKLKCDSIVLETEDNLSLHAVLHRAPDKATLKDVEICVNFAKKGKALGLELGMEKDVSGSKQLVIQTVRTDGVVAEFNTRQGEAPAAEDKRVLAGDLVLEVNGVRGDAERQMREFQNEQEFAVTLQRVIQVPGPTVLYLLPHQGNVSVLAPTFHNLAERLGVNVLAIDYRGYGKSTGKPDEVGIIEDCLCAWRWMCSDESRLDKNKLFVYGQQLGGAAAIALANELQKDEGHLPQGLLLENTFTSIDAWIHGLLPTLLRLTLSGPIRIFKAMFLRLQWKSLPIIANLNIPMLFITSRSSCVPTKMSTELSEAAKAAPVKRHVDSGDRTSLYWQEQQKFLNDCITREFPEVTK